MGGLSFPTTHFALILNSYLQYNYDATKIVLKFYFPDVSSDYTKTEVSRGDISLQYHATMKLIIRCTR